MFNMNETEPLSRTSMIYDSKTEAALDVNNSKARIIEQRKLAARLKREKMTKKFQSEANGSSPNVVGSGQGGTSIVARKLRADGAITYR